MYTGFYHLLTSYVYIILYLPEDGCNQQLKHKGAKKTYTGAKEQQLKINQCVTHVFTE
jgi:hypothetical protein